MAWIMRPRRAAPKAAAKSAITKSAAEAAMEAVTIEEPGVHKQPVTEPSAAPTPATPTEPAREKAADEKSRSKAKSKSKSRRIPQIRVRAPCRGAVDIFGLVDWNVDYLRIGRLDLDRILAALGIHSHYLLRRRLQPAVGLSSGTHCLHRIHHVGLLGQKRVSEIGSPSDIVTEQIQRIRECHQRLDARIPVLLLGCVQQLRALKVAIALEPLLRFGYLQRIGTGRQYLTEQWIGIKRHRRHQVI